MTLDDIQRTIAELRSLKGSLPSWQLVDAWEAFALTLVEELAGREKRDGNVFVTVPFPLPDRDGPPA